MKLARVERLVHLALSAYLLNCIIMVGIAIWQAQHNLTWLAALTVGRTCLSAVAVLLLLLAVRQLRTVAEIYQDHCRFLRQMVMVMVKRAVEADPEVSAALGEIEPPAGTDKDGWAGF